MELTLFQLVAIGLTVAWVIISFILDKKTGTSVMSYALFVIGCLFYNYGQIFRGSICIIIAICSLILFFLIYKNEHRWEIKNKKEEDKNIQ